MRIFIVTPAGKGSRNGNRNTAVRWAGLLRSLGHTCVVDTAWHGEPADLMVALHARRSHASIERFRSERPAAPLVLALTGTDLYRDIRYDADAEDSMRIADRMIVLQDQGLEELAAELREKTRVIYQSALPLARARPLARAFEVVVIGHLRDEKDPFRAALACSHLPAQSRLRVVHLGRSMSPEMQAEANRLMELQPRYRWLGELTHSRVRRYLARARAMVISSRMEGGANVVSEALAADVPVLASAVAGNIGMLGRDYTGYYPVEDERALAALLFRFETDAAIRRQLEAQCRARKPLITEACERASWKALLEELAPAVAALTARGAGDRTADRRITAKAAAGRS